MAEIKITKDNFETEVLQSDKPVLLDFWATWCGPCQMIAPTLKEIAEEYPQYKVGKVNVDEEEELAVKFGIESIPTLVVIKEGKVVNFSVGVKMKNSILEMLK
ncbi:MAG: thioredoxin [Clostridia bacterium]|nr:thioredoxin [Clostridia bacterium]